MHPFHDALVSFAERRVITMAEKITIRLFDGFEILKEGEPILENLSNTRKTKLFVAYLLVNRDRPVSHQELFELLWSGESYSNPATALRTLLYRFRAMLDKEGAETLSGAIISKKGTYQWNKNLEVSIDALDFQSLAKSGANKSFTVSKRRDYLENALKLYKGPLLPDFCSEPWLISKSAMYRELYLEVVEMYVSILKDEKRYVDIVEVCENAILLAGNSELLQLEIQLAKLKLIEPVPKDEKVIKSYYNTVKRLGERLWDFTEKMQKDLEDDAVEQRAFICDYRVFKEIYRLQRRLQSRSKATIFLGVVDVREQFSGKNDLDSAEKFMNDMVECCARGLRCGDAICRDDSNRISILFPAESYEDAVGVLERLKASCIERTDEDTVVVYRVRPLKNARE